MRYYKCEKCKTLFEGNGAALPEDLFSVTIRGSRFYPMQEQRNHGKIINGHSIQENIISGHICLECAIDLFGSEFSEKVKSMNPEGVEK